MGRYLISLLSVLSLTISLSGCGEGRVPGWFGKPKPKTAIEEEAQLEKTAGTLLASANKRVITLEDFNQRIEAYNNEIQVSKDIPDSVKPNYLIKTMEDKKRLLDGMVERELLIAEAIERGLDKDKELVQAINALKEQLLFARVIDSEKVKAIVSTSEIEEYYNLYKDAFAIPEERKVSMIALPGEEKAKEVLIALLQGGDFAALARENSADKSASSGGDIGFIVKTSPFPQAEKKTMFKKFEEVAFTLELNKPSAIFNGPQGFYIIKVTEIRESRQMLFTEVYRDIEQGLLLKKQEEVLKTLVGNLRKSANIVVREELLSNTD